jgi:hypothetical protein
MPKHSDQEQFIPASKIARTANYRNAQGERIGIPPSRVPETDDLFEFSLAISEGLREEGPPTGFYRYVLEQPNGPQQVANLGHVTAQADDYWEPPIDVAQEDREETSGRGAGTPGRGVPVTDRYGYEKEVGVTRAKRAALMQSQLRYLCKQAEDCVNRAQIAENSGKQELARLFDAKAEKFLSLAEQKRQEIALREDFETRG